MVGSQGDGLSQRFQGRRPFPEQIADQAQREIGLGVVGPQLCGLFVVLRGFFRPAFFTERLADQVMPIGGGQGVFAKLHGAG